MSRGGGQKGVVPSAGQTRTQLKSKPDSSLTRLRSSCPWRRMSFSCLPGGLEGASREAVRLIPPLSTQKSEISVDQSDGRAGTQSHDIFVTNRRVAITKKQTHGEKAAANQVSSMDGPASTQEGTRPRERRKVRYARIDRRSSYVPFGTSGDGKRPYWPIRDSSGQ